MKWQKKNVGSMCSKIGSGATPKGGAQVYVDSGISLIRSQNVYNGYFKYEGLSHITDDAAYKLRGVTVERDDVLLNITGDSVARCALVPDSVLPARVNQHVAILRTDKDILLPAYLQAVLTEPTMQSYMIGLASGQGGSRNALTKRNIEEFEIELPPLPIQRKIAEILGAYDDLIENNRRRIELLEKMARELYRERFVRRAGRRKSVSISEVCTVQYGYAFNGKLFNDTGNGLPIIRIRNIPSGASTDYTTEQAPDSYIVHDGEVLVGMDGEFHINLWSGGDAYLVQRSCCFRPFDDRLKGYLMEAIRAPIKYFENSAMGATVGHLGKKDIDTIEVAVPGEDEIEAFRSMFDERLFLALQNRNLARQRDRLLPRLLSGKLDVSKLVKEGV